MIPEGARVLDVGCGDGALLEHLVRTKKVDGRGIELSQQNVNACVARGLAVCRAMRIPIWWNIPPRFSTSSFSARPSRPRKSRAQVLEHMLRIGRQAVISLPNFGHWRVRLSLLFGGHMPRTRALGYEWYDTPNIHLCTIADFVDLTRKNGAVIARALALKGDHVAGECSPIPGVPISWPRARFSCCARTEDLYGLSIRCRRV